MAAITPSASAREFQLQSQLIAQAVERLHVVEGKGLEKIDHVAIARKLDDNHRRILTQHNIIRQDLVDLTEGLE